MSTKSPKPILVDFNTLSSRRPSGTYSPSVPVIAPIEKVFVNNPGRSASEAKPTRDGAAQAVPAPTATVTSDGK